MRLHVKKHKLLINLIADAALMGIFFVLLKPMWSGLSWHEWLGLALGGGVIVHLACHWKWVAQVTRRLLGRLSAQTRVYYALDVLLLVLFVVIIGSGLSISRRVLPALGLSMSRSVALFWVHKLSSLFALNVLSLKWILHYRQVLSAVRRYLPGQRRSMSGSSI